MGSLYRSKHELVLVYKNGTAPHINNVELGRPGRYRTNVWQYAGANPRKRLLQQNRAQNGHPDRAPDPVAGHSYKGILFEYRTLLSPDSVEWAVRDSNPFAKAFCCG